MEPASEIKALQLDLKNIGLLHEQPVKRYLQGRQKWDQRFSSATKRVKKERRKQILNAANLEREKRLEEDDEQDLWDLTGEHPPPSSIAARKDNVGLSMVFLYFTD